MEKVYSLVSGMHEDYQIHGIFPSFEDAERAKFMWGIESRYDHVDIEEWEIETIPPLPDLDGKLPFTVSIHQPERHPIYVSQGWYARSSSEAKNYTFSPNSDAEHIWESNSPVEEGYTFCQNTQRYEFYLFASDKEDAEKIALAKLLKLQ